MCNKTQCTIIPPHILEELAKRGNTNCKKTLNDTHRILQKRNTVLIKKLHGARFDWTRKVWVVPFIYKSDLLEI